MYVQFYALTYVQAEPNFMVHLRSMWWQFRKVVKSRGADDACTARCLAAVGQYLNQSYWILFLTSNHPLRIVILPDNMSEPPSQLLHDSTLLQKLSGSSAIIFAAAAMIMTAYWAHGPNTSEGYLGGLDMGRNTFNWHPVLMVAGSIAENSIVAEKHRQKHHDTNTVTQTASRA